MEKILPLVNKILCKEIPKECKIDLLKHRRRRTETKEGEVLECGANVKRVEKGNRIVYSGYSGRRLKRNGIDYLVLDEREIMGVVNG